MSKCVALGRLFSSNRESNHAKNLDSEQRKEIVSNCILVTWCQGNLAVEPMFFYPKLWGVLENVPSNNSGSFEFVVAIDTIHIIPINWSTVSVSSAFDERGDQCGTTSGKLFDVLSLGHGAIMGQMFWVTPKGLWWRTIPSSVHIEHPINGTRYVIHPLLNHTFLGCSIWNRGRHWLQLVCPQTLKTSENPHSYPIKSPIFIAKLSIWIWVNILPTNWWFWKHNLTKCVSIVTPSKPYRAKGAGEDVSKAYPQWLVPIFSWNQRD